MKKKQYINPEMTVVALAHQGYLLTISGDVQMNQIREEIKRYQKQLPIKDKDMNNTNEAMKKTNFKSQLNLRRVMMKKT